MSTPRKVVRYSEAFKRQVVSELGDGTLESLQAAQRRYGIKGTATVANWLRRYGRGDLLPRVVRVEKPGERDELRAMAARIRALEHALAETRMRELLAEGHFQALCREVGIEDPEGQKKKLGGTPSTGRGGAAPGKGA